MSPRHTSVRRTALRCGPRGAGVPWVESLAMTGGLADGGFGLVVVDQGNPRSRRGIATLAAAIAL
jgi:hypothetical protein